jgi:hypothetical protein
MPTADEDTTNTQNAEAQVAASAAAGTEAAPVTEVKPISERLLASMSPKQAEALRAVKGEKGGKVKSGTGSDAGQTGGLTSTVGRDAQPPGDAAKDAAGKKDEGLPADGETIIDLGETGDGGEGAEAGEGEEKQPNTEGLDEAGKERVIKLHKEQAKIRKRAQDAEKERDALKAERDTLKTQLEEAGSSGAAVASKNMFVQLGFTDTKEVEAWAQDAQKRINLLLDESRESKVHKLPNGEDLDLGDNETSRLIEAQQIIAHASDWKKYREERTQSTERSVALAKKFEKVPEFAAHHAEMTKLDPVASLPLLQARASIGALVESGRYILVKRGTNLPAKAAAASSAASTVPGAQEGTAGTMAKAAPPAEVASAVPSASRAGDESGPTAIPSELTERAMRGDQDAVKEIIRLKARGKQKKAA